MGKHLFRPLHCKWDFSWSFQIKDLSSSARDALEFSTAFFDVRTLLGAVTSETPNLQKTGLRIGAAPSKCMQAQAPSKPFCARETVLFSRSIVHTSAKGQLPALPGFANLSMRTQSFWRIRPCLPAK